MQIIKILTYTLAPLVIGYVTTVITKRKEVEMKVKRDFLYKRINAYARIHTFMRNSSLMIAPPMYREAFLADFLKGTKFTICYQLTFLHYKPLL